MRLSSVITVILCLMLAGFFSVGIFNTDLDGATGIDLGVRVNAQPVVTAPSVNPSSIPDNADASITLSCTATDSDGTVGFVNATCSLWGSNVWALTKGTGDSWSGTFTILKANLTSTGAKTVTFTAEDNASGTGTNTTDITVTIGNTVPTSDYDLDTPFAVKVDEDSGNYIHDLTDLIEDDDMGNVSFQIGPWDSFGTSFTHDNFSVALENDTWINVTLTENGLVTSCYHGWSKQG